MLNCLSSGCLVIFAGALYIAKTFATYKCSRKRQYSAAMTETTQSDATLVDHATPTSMQYGSNDIPCEDSDHDQTAQDQREAPK